APGRPRALRVNHQARRPQTAQPRLLDVPVSGKRRAHAISCKPWERCRELTVSKFNAQGEPRHARECQFAAAKEMKSDAVGRRDVRGGRRRRVQRLMTNAQTGSDVRPDPEVITHGIEEPIDDGGLDLHRRDTASGYLARHGIAGEPDLNAETI